MIKVFPLSIGATKVPFGQFYGGWTGFNAFFQLATDKSHPMLVPIMAYLIDHPKAGPILMDTGISRWQAHDHKNYYKGIMGAATDVDEYILTPEQELPAQLERFGYRTTDIQRVILTHLHEDHVGGLRHVSHAEVVLPQTEWNVRHQKLVGMFPIYYAPSYSMIQNWKIVGFDSGPFHSFDSSHDLLGDGTIRLIPTPGHTGGHASVVVEADGYQIFLAADALYTLRHLAVDQVHAFVPGPIQYASLYVDTIKRIQRLRDALPDMVIVPTHDHSDYGYNLIPSVLADGVLTLAGKHKLQAYESRIFDKQWQLRAEEAPVYNPPKANRQVGEVIYSL